MLWSVVVAMNGIHILTATRSSTNKSVSVMTKVKCVSNMFIDKYQL